MIKHIVCFKIKDEYKDKIIEAKNRFLSMKENIPYLVSVEVGIDFLHSKRSYDIILVTTFLNKEDLARYQEDSYHCSYVKTLMHEIRSASVSVDYEI